ncbi:hypothetical protein DFP73DRAFT_534555 [Morchella snyderi]|nr:hypothetical protein DFP73DRAFT_534555 [Morchella snyderi]
MVFFANPFSLLFFFFVHLLSESWFIFCIGLVVGLWLYTLVAGVCFAMLPTSYVNELERAARRRRSGERL